MQLLAAYTVESVTVRSPYPILCPRFRELQPSNQRAVINDSESCKEAHVAVAFWVGSNLLRVFHCYFGAGDARAKPGNPGACAAPFGQPNGEKTAAGGFWPQVASKKVGRFTHAWSEVPLHPVHSFSYLYHQRF